MPVVVQGIIVGEIRALAFGNESSEVKTDLARNGWVECAGQSLKRSDFPDLFRLIGDNWGSSDGQNTFCLPDLRGLILRGWQHASLPGQAPAFGGDPDAGSRLPPRLEITPPGTKGRTGDHVGSMQRDQARVEHHTHSEVRESGTLGRASAPSEPFMHTPQVAQTGPPEGPATQFETRPKNAYVMYVIFAGKPVNIGDNSDEIEPLEL